ncbi:MAG: hypothetical protein ACFCUU_13235 [Cyclobacteriaceae bacterium]
MRLLFLVSFLAFVTNASLVQAQSTDLPPHEEDLKQALLELRTDVDNIQFNLGKSHKRFKLGIAAATIGYTVTIAGGLMLGRENDQLGQGLLIAGGAIGLTGTVILVDAFRFVGRASGNKYQGNRKPIVIKPGTP